MEYQHTRPMGFLWLILYIVSYRFCSILYWHSGIFQNKVLKNIDKHAFLTIKLIQLILMEISMTNKFLLDIRCIYELIFNSTKRVVLYLHSTNRFLLFGIPSEISPFSPHFSNREITREIKIQLASFDAQITNK